MFLHMDSHSACCQTDCLFS